MKSTSTNRTDYRQKTTLPVITLAEFMAHLTRSEPLLKELEASQQQIPKTKPAGRKRPGRVKG